MQPGSQSKDLKVTSTQSPDQQSKLIQQSTQRNDIFSGFGGWTQSNATTGGTNNTQITPAKSDPVKTQPGSHQPVINGKSPSPQQNQTSLQSSKAEEIDES